MSPYMPSPPRATDGPSSNDFKLPHGTIEMSHLAVHHEYCNSSGITKDGKRCNDCCAVPKHGDACSTCKDLNSKCPIFRTHAALVKNIGGDADKLHFKDYKKFWADIDAMLDLSHDMLGAGVSNIRTTNVDKKASEKGLMSHLVVYHNFCGASCVEKNGEKCNNCYAMPKHQTYLGTNNCLICTHLEDKTPTFRTRDALGRNTNRDPNLFESKNYPEFWDYFDAIIPASRKPSRESARLPTISESAAHLRDVSNPFSGSTSVYDDDETAPAPVANPLYGAGVSISSLMPTQRVFPIPSVMPTQTVFPIPMVGQFDPDNEAAVRRFEQIRDLDPSIKRRQESVEEAVRASEERKTNESGDDDEITFAPLLSPGPAHTTEPIDAEPFTLFEVDLSNLPTVAASKGPVFDAAAPIHTSKRNKLKQKFGRWSTIGRSKESIGDGFSELLKNIEPLKTQSTSITIIEVKVEGDPGTTTFDLENNNSAQRAMLRGGQKSEDSTQVSQDQIDDKTAVIKNISDLRSKMAGSSVNTSVRSSTEDKPKGLVYDEDEDEDDCNLFSPADLKEIRAYMMEHGENICCDGGIPWKVDQKTMNDIAASLGFPPITLLHEKAERTKVDELRVKKRTERHFGDELEMKYETTPRDLVLQSAPIICEIETNAIFKDGQQAFMVDLAYALSEMYRLPETSINITIRSGDSGIMMMQAGTFDACYTIKITALSELLSSSVNRTSAAMLYKEMMTLIRVPQDRGIIQFVARHEDDLASGGETLGEAMIEANKRESQRPMVKTQDAFDDRTPVGSRRLALSMSSSNKGVGKTLKEKFSNLSLRKKKSDVGKISYLDPQSRRMGDESDKENRIPDKNRIPEESEDGPGFEIWEDKEDGADLTKEKAEEAGFDKKTDDGKGDVGEFDAGVGKNDTVGSKAKGHKGLMKSWKSIGNLAGRRAGLH